MKNKPIVVLAFAVLAFYAALHTRVYLGDSVPSVLPALTQQYGNILCYGQHVPICSLNYKPACVCSTGTADLCAYVCMPK